jgi:hypothetical protein
LHRISSVTGETSLVKLLKRFVHNIDVPDGFFYPRITEEQNERAEWLDTLDLSVAEKFTMSLVPISTGCRPWKAPGALGAIAGEKKISKLQPHPQGCSGKPAGSRGHLPYVLGLCLARLPHAGILPQHRGSAATGARSVGARRFAAAAAECGRAQAGVEEGAGALVRIVHLAVFIQPVAGQQVGEIAGFRQVDFAFEKGEHGAVGLLDRQWLVARIHDRLLIDDASLRRYGRQCAAIPEPPGPAKAMSAGGW